MILFINNHRILMFSISSFKLLLNNKTFCVSNNYNIWYIVINILLMKENIFLFFSSCIFKNYILSYIIISLIGKKKKY